MDRILRRRSSAPDRSFGDFSPRHPPPPPTNAADAAGDGELHEHDLFFHSPDRSPPKGPKKGIEPPYGRGLLDVLREEDHKKQKPLIRGANLASSVAAVGAVALKKAPHLYAGDVGDAGYRKKVQPLLAEDGFSRPKMPPLPESSVSPTSSAMAIPENPKPRRDSSLVTASAPVNVPMRPPARGRSKWEEMGDIFDDEDDADGNGIMVPPHEMVARASGIANGSPMAPFSVLEGVGRTLKGRDLRRVRDAVLRQTGFLD